MSHFGISLLSKLACLAAVALAAACSDVPPTNPYDPATPAESQAAGIVRGRLVLPSEYLERGFGGVKIRLTGLRGVGQDFDERTTTPDKEGAFTLNDVVADAYTLDATAPGFAIVPKMFLLDVGASVDLGAIPLEAVLDARLEGTVLLGGVVDGQHGGTRVELAGTPLTAVTSQDGRFSLTGTAAAHDVRVHHPGYASQTVAGVTLVSGLTVQLPGTITLAGAPGRITGRVRFALGFETADDARPVEVTLVSVDTDIPDPLPQVTTVLEDEAFAFEDLAAGTYEISAHWESFRSVPVERVLSVGEAGDIGLLVLQPPDVGGAPKGLVQGMAQRVGAPEGTHGGIKVQVASTPYSTETEPDGHFTLSLPAGPYTLQITSDGYAGQAVEIRVREGLDTILPSPILLVAQPGRLSGGVRFARGYEAQGNPRPVTVSLTRVDAEVEPASQVVVEGQGFLFDGLVPGRYRVEAHWESYSAEPIERNVHIAEDVDGGLLTLQPPNVGPEVRTRVQGHAERLGRPADGHGGILVEVANTPISVQTATDGYFELAAPPGPQHLRFTAPGYAAADADVHLVEGETFTLPDTVLLSGQDGRLRGLVVVVGGAEPVDPDVLTRVSVDLYALGEAEPRRTVSPEPTGDFVIDPVPAGDWRVVARLNGFEPFPRLVSLGPGQDATLEPLTLRTPGDAGAMRSFIQGTARLGCAGECDHGGIRVEAQGFGFVSQTTSDGTFRLELSPADHVLVFTHPGYAPESRQARNLVSGENRLEDVLVDARPVVLRAADGRLSGSVVLSQFDSAARRGAIRVGLTMSDNTRIGPLPVAADGAFVFNGLRPGSFIVQATAPGYTPALVTADVVGDAEARVGALLLRHQSETDEAVTFVGHVIPRGSGDLAGTVVQVRFADQDLAYRVALTDVEGRFDLPASPEDAYVVEVERTGYVPARDGPYLYDADTAGYVAENGGGPVLIELTPDLGDDGDHDNDSVRNAVDNCRDVANPDQEDLDGDGTGDACDVDQDGDLVPDRIEDARGSNPRLTDSDGDTLSDLEEQELGTDPTRADTDGDGEHDGAEVGLDPRAPNDADGDRLIDALESSVLDSDLDGASDEADGPGPLGDLDGDGVTNAGDNCPNDANSAQLNTDGDAWRLDPPRGGDACDADDDDDGVDDLVDNCPLLPNADQENFDGDDRGDDCDADDDNDGLSDAREGALGADAYNPDSDEDGVVDGGDDCPAVEDADQTDTDGDHLGDACDEDDDGDGAADTVDNCVLIANADQTNTDGDLRGNACDIDDDNDGVLDPADVCPLAADPFQEDSDGDRLGDACDDDDDRDGVLDVSDNCPLVPNSLQEDQDRDGIGDVCSHDRDGDTIQNSADNCPAQPNRDQRDMDNDGLGDACDDDADADRVADVDDNCQLLANPAVDGVQGDLDGDGFGDACDPDRDGDDVDEGPGGDNCVRVANPGQQDRDNDGSGDLCDNCPLRANAGQADLDSDGIGDACDPDQDGDGVDEDGSEGAGVACRPSEREGCDDNCPRTRNPGQEDSDGDGFGDVCSKLFENVLYDLDSTDIARDGDAMWVTTNGGGVIRYSAIDYSWTKYTNADGLLSNVVTSVAVDPAGNKWFGTDQGLGELSAGGRWERFVAGPGTFPEARVVDVAAGPDGAIYVATAGAVTRRQGANWEVWQRGAGLIDAPVQSVNLSPTGEVWIGTALGASVRAATGAWRSYSVINGLLGPSVSGVGFEPDGTAWILQRQGVVRVAPVVGAVPRGFSTNPVSAFAISGDGTKWVGGAALARLGPDGSPGIGSLKRIPGRSTNRIVRQLGTGPDGTVWVAGDVGVSRLTAVITNWTVADGLPRPPVDSVSFGGGSAWAGTRSDGVARMGAGNRWTTWRATDGLSSNAVRSLFHDGTVLWAGTSNGISRLAANGVVGTLQPPGSVDIRSVLFDGSNLWAGTSRGVSRLSPQGHWTEWTTANGLGTNDIRGLSDDGESIWAGGAGQDGYGISHLTADGTCVPLEPSRDVSFSSTAHDGQTLWAGSSGGVHEFAPDGHWSTWSTSEGLGYNDVKSVFVDGDELWAATRFGGVSRLSGGTWVTWTTSDGLLDEHVNSVFHDGESVWLGTDGGVSRLSSPDPLLPTTNVGWRPTNIVSGVDGEPMLVIPTINSGLQGYQPLRARRCSGDSHTRLWCVAPESPTPGLHRYDGVWPWFSLTTAHGLPSNTVNDLAIDPNDNIWLATAGGVSQLRGNQFHNYSRASTANGLASNDVRAVVLTDDGSVWFGTAAGVSRLDPDGEWTVLGPGLPSASVRDLEVDSSGHVWASTDRGVSRWEGALWWTPPVAQFPAIQVVALDSLPDGRVLAATSQGLYVVNPSGSVSRYTMANGLAWNAITDVYVQPDGTAWLALPGAGGVSKFIGGWDPDEDHDGVPWPDDNCPFVINQGQGDADGDRIGDACDGL